MPLLDNGVAAASPERSDKSKPYSVSQALDIVKGALRDFRMTIVGEVSELSSKRGYKAVYFTIKDRSSSLKCLMWNDLYRSSGLDLEVGQEVEISGFFSLYAARGTMNFDVRRLSLAGEGRLRMEVARLARKLEAEGLMDPARKRKLPPFPRVVGVVTSPHGDAVHDVLRTLRRRWPMARVVLAGVQVEGVGAPAALVSGLHCVVDAGAELVILGRGGGSYESMMPFNDEGLVRAVADCPIPVVTGIGHEPDNFIADLVADVRTSTPTLAAVAAVPNSAEVREMLGTRRLSMNACATRALSLALSELRRLSSRPVMRDARQLFAQEAMGVDHLAARLQRALPATLDEGAREVARLHERLKHVMTMASSAERMRVETDRGRLAVSLSQLVARFRQQMGLRAARLNDLSPLAILSRGYAIARDGSGAVVKQVDSVAVGDRLQVQVSDGAIDCRVEGVRCMATESVELG